MADTARTLMLDVPAVSPETDVATASRLMRRLHVHHLPVVEQRQCVGLVGEAELAGATGPDDLVGLLCRRPAPCVSPDAAEEAHRRHAVLRVVHGHSITTPRLPSGFLVEARAAAQHCLRDGVQAAQEAHPELDVEPVLELKPGIDLLADESE